VNSPVRPRIACCHCPYWFDEITTVVLEERSDV
jgi:hypothetical protein